MPTHRTLLPVVLLAAVACGGGSAAPPNKVVGSWRMVTADLQQAGGTASAYGRRPSGMLIFAPDLHYVEVLTDADVPRFKSGERGQGTDAENRAAMAGGIGMFGTYTVDANGELTGDHVVGATFPNWVGDTRTRKDIQIVVTGDTMVETFTRPGGARIVIRYQRAR